MNEQTQTNVENSHDIVATIRAHELVGYDLKNAVLIVSIIANLFFFTTWLALQITTAYDAQLVSFFLGR